MSKIEGTILTDAITASKQVNKAAKAPTMPPQNLLNAQTK